MAESEMNVNTADKGNEERELDVPVSSADAEQEQPIDARAQASCSVPLEESKSVPTQNGNFVVENKNVSAVDFISRPDPTQNALHSVSLEAVTGSADPHLQVPADVKAKACEVPDTKEDGDNTVSINSKPKAEAPGDSSVETPIDSAAEPCCIPQGEAPANSRVEAPTDSAAQGEAPANSRVEAPTDSAAEPCCIPQGEAPADSGVQAPTDSAAETPASSRVEAPIASRVETPTNSVAKPATESYAGPSSTVQLDTPKPNASSSDIELKNVNEENLKSEAQKTEFNAPAMREKSNTGQLFLLDGNHDGNESGTEEEQSAFMKEIENFFRERNIEFKPPKFYGVGINCLKLWRAVTRLGGYDKVTSCKLWRQVGDSFKPPKTCTTVSWTFRGFYEKALLDYERHKSCGSELGIPVVSHSGPMDIDNQASGSGRARRDAAARAMQGWHSQRVLDNDEVSDPIIKDKNPMSQKNREKQLRNPGLVKRKKPSYMEDAVKAARLKTSKSQVDVAVTDIGPPADWVKINVQRTKDCFEVYALVPGLLREEVRVQSDPAGRLVISGEPEHPDNPWGVTPFKKVVSLPARIDPHHTSAVVTLHGQLFVRVPFEQSD